MEYIVLINSKREAHAAQAPRSEQAYSDPESGCMDKAREVETVTGIKELRKQYPDFVIKRGNSWNWNIMLWRRDTNVHLYYVAKRK